MLIKCNFFFASFKDLHGGARVSLMSIKVGLDMVGFGGGGYKKRERRVNFVARKESAPRARFAECDRCVLFWKQARAKILPAVYLKHCEIMKKSSVDSG